MYRLAKTFLPIFSLGLLQSATPQVEQSSTYQAQLGHSAIVQRALELKNSSVVMAIALEPGYEDFPTLAYLRLVRGATVVSLFVTNGEATPSDYSGDVPLRVAARRKEEAYQTSRSVGADAYFLNLKDYGFVTNRAELAKLWQPDSVVAKLADALKKVRPDVVLLAKDFREQSGESLRQKVFTDILLEAVRAASDTSRELSEKPHGEPLPWRVQRIFVDMASEGQPFHVDIESKDPLRSKSPRAIAEELGKYYESLRAQLPTWNSRGDRSYSLLHPAGVKPFPSFDFGLPILPPKLEKLSTEMNTIAYLAAKRSGTNVLPLIKAALESVDAALGLGNRALSSVERRVLAGWKKNLESLRCAVMDVEIEYEVLDTLVSRLQLSFLKFTRFESKARRGFTEIYFPEVAASPGYWSVNESVSSKLPFRLNEQYRILTPNTLEFNTPLSAYGMDKPTVTTPFSFIVVHRTADGEPVFRCEKEIPFRVAPRFASEVLSPIVYVTPGEHVVYRLQNFTRDGVYGDAFVEDSLASSDKKRFRLSTKDSSVLDTLTLSWHPPIQPGNYFLDLKISDVTVGRFLARSFRVASDTSGRVGLITGIEGSAVGEAMRRLRIPYAELDSSSLAAGDLSSFSTIVIDRDAASLRRDAGSWISRLEGWVQSGGHVVVLPQYSLASGKLSIEKVWSFHPYPGLDPESRVSADSTHPFLSRPNRIEPSDWNGWIFARARGFVEVDKDEAAEILVKSRDSGAPLLVAEREGEGRITYVALDITPQLMNVHPGAFRLLANILDAATGSR